MQRLKGGSQHRLILGWQAIDGKELRRDDPSRAG